MAFTSRKKFYQEHSILLRTRTSGTNTFLKWRFCSSQPQHQTQNRHI